MPPDAWNPAQYDRFRAERQQPFFDLLGLVRPQPEMRVVDLGCGTGELTSALHRRLGARETLGLDSSDAMIARSDAYAESGQSASPRRLQRRWGRAQIACQRIVWLPR